MPGKEAKQCRGVGGGKHGGKNTPVKRGQKAEAMMETQMGNTTPGLWNQSKSGTNRQRSAHRMEFEVKVDQPTATVRSSETHRSWKSR